VPHLSEGMSPALRPSPPQSSAMTLLSVLAREVFCRTSFISESPRASCASFPVREVKSSVFAKSRSQGAAPVRKKLPPCLVPDRPYPVQDRFSGGDDVEPVGSSGEVFHAPMILSIPPLAGFARSTSPTDGPAIVSGSSWCAEPGQEAASLLDPGAILLLPYTW